MPSTSNTAQSRAEGAHPAPSAPRSAGEGARSGVVEMLAVAGAKEDLLEAEGRRRDMENGPYAFGYEQKLAQAREAYPEKDIDGYILFGSHTDALALYDAAKKQGFTVRISPTPRDARASCGVALLCKSEEVLQVFQVALEKRIAIENMVALPRQTNAKRDKYC